MKVFFTYPIHSEFAPWESGFVPALRNELQADGGRHENASGFEDAEIVVLVESQTWKDRHHSSRLHREPVLQGACGKVVTLNYEDSPAGFLPGAYSSLSPLAFNEAQHISWPLLFLPNEDVYKVTLDTFRDVERELLFSFVGAPSHPLRQRLFSKYGEGEGRFKVIEMKRWYNYSEEEKRSFVDDIWRSDFVLCPRGATAYSHRISEVMALGRVPVVIADDWVPFSIPEKGYYIHIPEADVEKCEEILGNHRGEARQQGVHAREVWQKYFSPNNRAGAVVDALAKVRQSGATLRTYQKRWDSYAFKKLKGWTFAALAKKWLWRKLRRSRQKAPGSAPFPL